VTIRAIIVDIGGVLLLRDEMPAHGAWEDRLGIDRGGFARGLFRPELAAQATVGAVSAAQVWAEMAARLSLSEADVRALRRDFFAGERLNEAFVAFLRECRPVYQTAALSNAWSGTRAAMRVHYGLDRLVDLMIFSDEEGIAKPDARIYHLAAERLGVQPDEAIFVDDVVRNVEAARALRMLAVHFRDTAQSVAEIEAYLRADGRYADEGNDHAER
jgi:epoxide hydrolase-like predicted phosphatase